jgi:hypothetical protein
MIFYKDMQDSLFLDNVEFSPISLPAQRKTFFLVVLVESLRFFSTNAAPQGLQNHYTHYSLSPSVAGKIFDKLKEKPGNTALFSISSGTSVLNGI